MSNKIPNSLFVILDGKRVNLIPEQIFDVNKYDEFYGVTYSASAQFINSYITKFHKIDLILGVGERKSNSRTYQALSSSTKNMINNLTNQLSHKMTNMYQHLNDYAKKLLVSKDFRLLAPFASTIHCKFYLLKNSKTNKKRLVIGSANLSGQAFNNNVQQFEDILIFDDDQLYDLYFNYFKDELVPTTKNYFPKELIKLTAKKLKDVKKEIKSDDDSEIDEVAILSPDEIKEVEKADFKESIQEFNHKIALGLIVPTTMNEMKELKEKSNSIQENNKNDNENQQTSLNLITDSINMRTKVPKFKSDVELNKIYSKDVHIAKVKDVGENVAQRKANLISEPKLRNIKNSGLFTEDKKDHKLFKFGRIATREEIIDNLNGIQELMNNYKQFTVDGDNQYCSRVMEAIFYAFEAPFLYEIRRKVSPTVEGQDIPQFLFIGGQGGSGKSSLLKILIRLLGIYDNNSLQLYDQIIPEGTSKQKAKTIEQIGAWISTENVAPIIVDDIPSYFFTNQRYGSDLIVGKTNLTNENPQPFPVFIGSTNSSNYSFSERAKRRSYYLDNDKVFDKTYRKQSSLAFNKALQSLNSNLFNDFCMRFSNLLIEKEDDFWLDYGKTDGLYDFLRGTRLIFKEYYSECGLPLPKFFPDHRYDDEQENDRLSWRKLFEGYPELFKRNPNNKKTFLFNISKLNENQGKNYSQLSPADSYRNSLDSRVVKGNKNGMQIEIYKKRFFNWLGISPKRTWFWKWF